MNAPRNWYRYDFKVGTKSDIAKSLETLTNVKNNIRNVGQVGTYPFRDLL